MEKAKMTISKGTVGHGQETHILVNGKTACGTGKVSTGSRRSSTTRPSDNPVTCAKCLSRLGYWQERSKRDDPYFEYTSTL
jgi:hypothetical protein